MSLFGFSSLVLKAQNPLLRRAGGGVPPATGAADPRYGSCRPPDAQALGAPVFFARFRMVSYAHCTLCQIRNRTRNTS